MIFFFHDTFLKPIGNAMKDKQSQQPADRSETTADSRKPFVPPKLRAEAGLTQATGGTFTFSTTAS
jgi:hypothetical protein